MTRTLLTLAAAGALLGAGCGGTKADEPTAAAPRTQAAKFSACMRDHGVRDFPDPDARGELTIDAVANEARVDTDTPAFAAALRSCRDLRPSGFTGRKATPKEQDVRLRFAQCMRDNGIADFPDPLPDGPLIDTNRIPSMRGRGALEVPGFTEAQDRCGAVFGDELGLPKR